MNLPESIDVLGAIHYNKHILVQQQRRTFTQLDRQRWHFWERFNRDEDCKRLKTLDKEDSRRPPCDDDPGDYTRTKSTNCIFGVALVTDCIFLCRPNAVYANDRSSRVLLFAASNSWVTLSWRYPLLKKRARVITPSNDFQSQYGPVHLRYVIIHFRRVLNSLYNIAHECIYCRSLNSLTVGYPDQSLPVFKQTVMKIDDLCLTK